MAFGNQPTNYAALLKEYYADGGVPNAIFQENALFGMLSKKTDADGKYFVQPIIVGAGASRSAGFTSAQNASSLTGDTAKRFQIPMVPDHAIVNISTELIMETKNNSGAFLRAASQVGDDAVINFSNSIAMNLYRTSDGNRGQISTTTTIASSTLKLAIPADSFNFEIGMALDLAAAQVTGGVRAYGTNNHGLYVIAVDNNKGTLTIGTTPVAGGTACNISDAADGIPTAAQSDFIYIVGDRNLKMNGVLDWIPYGGPLGGDSFLGVDRTAQPTRLAGNWYDGTSGANLISIIEQALAQMGALGGRPDYLFVPFKAYGQIVLELGSKIQLTASQSSGKISVLYNGVSVMGPKGPVTVLPDRSCPSNRMFALKLDTWTLLSVDDMPHLWDLDGLDSLRTSNQSGLELRWYAFGNLKCDSPRDNMVIAINP